MADVPPPPTPSSVYEPQRIRYTPQPPPKPVALKTPTAKPTQKTTAGAASGVVIGAPLSVVFIYLLSALGVNPPAAVDVAIGSLVAILCSFIASYYVPPGQGESPVPASL